MDVENENWLPDEVLAEILAKVPLGREKVALQCVNRQWRDVLRCPEAHSLETWDADECMPTNPTTPLQNGASKISLAFVAALPGYKAGSEDAHVVASWEGWEHLTGLEALELWVSEEVDWELCPQFPLLRTLIQRGYRLPPRFSTFFPVLKDVDFAEEESDPEKISAHMTDLETLPSIECISLEVSDLVGYRGPPDCRIDYRFHPWGDPLELWLSELPDGLASHLKLFSIDFEEDLECEEDGICLNVLSECVFLEGVEIVLGDRVETRDLRITGLAALPASCLRVVIRSFLGEALESGPPCVQPAEGWKVELVRPPDEPYRDVVCSRVPGQV